MHKFGIINPEDEQAASCVCSKAGVLYSALMDREAMWDPETIEIILREFPDGHIEKADVFLVLTECIANAVMHGYAKALGFCARERHGIVLFTFIQFPPMQERINTILNMARNGNMQDFTQDLPGGLGFPILLRLAHFVTISPDLTRLQLWFRK